MSDIKIPSGWRVTELRSECGRYVVTDYGMARWYAQVLPSFTHLEMAAATSLGDAVAVCEKHARLAAVHVGPVDANGTPVEP